MNEKPEIERLLNDGEGNSCQQVVKLNCSRLLGIFLYGILGGSLCLNLFQAGFHRSQATKTESHFLEPLSNFAQLKNNEINAEFIMYSDYATYNATERDILWDPVGEASGTVAIAKTWAAEKGLPAGRKVPWDDSKALYAINAYHSLHCIKSIYVSLRDYRLSIPQSIPEHHVFHCLDQLRADVVCAADDTLRAGNSVQPRKCRSFKKLEDWMNANPSCIPEGDDNRLKERQPVHLPVLRECPENPLDQI